MVTYMTTNCSKTGVAFALMQNTCSVKRSPLDGGQLCLTGSKFCSGVEFRYSHIEGEALAVVWSLKKAKHFAMGCMNLHIGLDHKPLLGIFSPTRPWWTSIIAG